MLVVDDLGNQNHSGYEVIDSPWISTIAIMPQRPFSVELAEYAHKLGKEVIVHAPMSNLVDFPLGALGLDRAEGEQRIEANVVSALISVPHAVGLSNHMGSRLTQDPEAMGWIMQVLKQKGVYFFDSRTVSTTVAWKVAERYRVPWAMRSIFLDHQKDREFMLQQWQQAWRRVLAGEEVTVICHPYPETIAFLKSQELTPAQQAFLAPLSAVLHSPILAPRAKHNMPIDI